MRTLTTSDIETVLAAVFNENGTNAPLLECSVCGRIIETYTAGDLTSADAEAADRRISDLIEHCAYDHGSPADINRLDRTPVLRFTH